MGQVTEHVSRLRAMIDPDQATWDLSPNDVAAIAAVLSELDANPARLWPQQRVGDWADQTFGPSGSNARVAARANEEMAELLRALTADDGHPKAGEEVADVVIVLYRLASRLGVDLLAEIDRKMEVNRSRVWKRDATGHGYHVRDK